jgi:hypothetical protein
VRVALGRADGHTLALRDLLEGQADRVLEHDHARLVGRDACEAAPKLAAQLGQRRLVHRVGVHGGARVVVERLPAARPLARGDVLARIHDEPVQPRRELRLAPELADPDAELREGLLRGVASVLAVPQQVEGKPLHARRVPLAQDLEGPPVTVFRPSHENGIAQPAVVEGRLGPQRLLDSTGRAGRGLHRSSLTAVEDSLRPDDVVPRLRGTYGRVAYVYAEDTPSTQRLLHGRPHGAVAVADHQTEGRGRRGSEWVDVPGRSLLVSVVLEPQLPQARWPELTLVAARAVVAAIGEVAGLAAEIDPPNDVLVGGRKVAGILAEAGERVVLGIGINVGETAWPGSGALGERVDRAELLVTLLEALERGYEDWARGVG